MPQGVGVRAFAKLDGCSHTAVQNGIKSGSIPLLEDGSIDPALAKTAWRAGNSRPVRGGKSRRLPQKLATTGGNLPSDAGQSPLTAEPSDDEDALLHKADDFIRRVLTGDYASEFEADRVKANALALQHVLKARERAGTLMEIAVAENVLFEAARNTRDAWLNFPTRVGPRLAADLNVDPDKLVEALTVHVHRQLEDLGEPEGRFAPSTETAPA